MKRLVILAVLLAGCCADSGQALKRGDRVEHIQRAGKTGVVTDGMMGGAVRVSWDDTLEVQTVDDVLLKKVQKAEAEK